MIFIRSKRITYRKYNIQKHDFIRMFSKHLIVNKILIMQKRLTESPLSKTFKSREHSLISPRKSLSKSHQQQHSLSKSNKKQHTIPNQNKLQVFIKLRANRKNGQEESIKYMNQHEMQIHTALKDKIYTFDYIFNEDSSQMQVFEVGCKQVIEHVIEQCYANEDNQHYKFNNVCKNNGLIFVYGNTGTGKTHTMGLLNNLDQHSIGIVPTSIKYLFDATTNSATTNNAAHQNKHNYSQIEAICLSFSEIYMDDVYDLLALESNPDTQGYWPKLQLREHTLTKQPYLENQVIISVTSAAQAFQLINIGLEKRRVAEQKINRRSSRGHGIITLHLKDQEGDLLGRLSFVDLAGCERIKESESKGSILNEALHINSSLSALETLLMNISDQNVRSYRGSKLTRILQPYIQYGKIQLFVTTNYSNISCVEFAKRCKGIKFLERECLFKAAQNSNLKAGQKSNLNAGENSNLNANRGRQVHHSEKSSCMSTNMSNKNQNNSESKKESLQRQKNMVQRQKNMVQCITNLMGMIHNMARTLQDIFTTQSINTGFSLADILTNIEHQEQQINHKISSLEIYENKIISLNVASLQNQMDKALANMLVPQASSLIAMMNNPAYFISKMHENSHCIIESIKQLNALSEYKNIYKKQLFTSELKYTLLQTQNQQLQHENQLLQHENQMQDQLLQMIYLQVEKMHCYNLLNQRKISKRIKELHSTKMMKCQQDSLKAKNKALQGNQGYLREAIQSKEKAIQSKSRGVQSQARGVQSQVRGMESQVRGKQSKGDIRLSNQDFFKRRTQSYALNNSDRKKCAIYIEEN